MTRIRDLHKKWMKDLEYRQEYDALEDEYALAAEVAQARLRSGLSQTELARQMKTTQSTIARLESGRGRPSTRTLHRFAEATGHRLKISFEPRPPAKHAGIPAADASGRIRRPRDHTARNITLILA